MSTTGKYLFPEDDDGGWVTTIIKSLPKDEPPVPALTPEQMQIEDPVGIEADAAFSGLAAETATRDAIFAAGWSADVSGAEKAPPPTQTELEALDAAIANEAGDAFFGVVDDPVQASADAAFAETAADVAQQHAIEAAGWTAGTVRSADAPRAEPSTETALTPEAIEALDSVIAREAGNPDLAAIVDPIADEAQARFAEDAARQATEDALADAGWWARPATDDGRPTPGELKALDAIADKAADADSRFAKIEDPIAFAADAAFAETAAEVATADALRAARAAAPQPGAPLSADELKTLDEIAARVGDIEARFAAEDPVGIEAEAAFAERAAELAIADALFAASWHPRATSADTVVADLVRRGRGLAEMEIEDLVRAEAEIAFEDAAYDLAYAAVDSLVTGEAAALAAFDQAIATGADPEEALQLAIAAAEEMDPRAFGGLTRAATLTLAPDDIGLVRAPGAAHEAEAAEARAEAERPALDPTAPPAFTVAAVGQGFVAVTGAALLFGSEGTDTLIQPDFRFVLDPDVISAPGSGFEAIERDDDDLLFVAPAARNPIRGTGGDDLLVGTAGDDAIAGLEGDDYLYGDRPTNFDPGVHDAGNPLANPVFGVGGDDVISGGAGSDSIWGGPGNDVIDGDVTDGAGLTGLFPFALGSASTGDDVIHGGDGSDAIHGGGGADTLYGDGGNDNIFGYAGDDVIVGGQGIDVVAGGAGADEFRFEGGTGADALAHAQSLGTDVVTDYSDADGDTFALSDADFGLGAAGTLTDGVDYYEHAPATLGGAPLDASGGGVGPAIVVFGDGAGADGVSVYYTDDASAMTQANSYQIADVDGTNLNQIEAGDFNLRA